MCSLADLCALQLHPAGRRDLQPTNVPSNYILLEEELPSQPAPQEDVNANTLTTLQLPPPTPPPLVKSSPSSFIGPILPPAIKSSITATASPVKLNGQLKPLKRSNSDLLDGVRNKKSRSDSLDGPTPSPSTSVSSVNSDCAPSCSGINDQLCTSSSALLKKRKRFLSERGEREAAYPVIDHLTRNLHSWKGFALAERRSARYGAGCALQNPSNDCFMNAVLQALVHTPALCRFVREKHNPEMCQVDRCGLCAMHRHIGLVMNPTSDQPVRAKGMKMIVKKVLPHHWNGNQEDAHETLCLLLDSLEPPMPPRKPNIPTSLPPMIAQKKTSNAIEQIFGGTFRNRIKCRNCSAFTIGYERIRELNLSMHQRLKGNNGVPVRLTTLLQDHFVKDVIDEFNCPHCKQKSPAYRFTRILRPPSVLIIQLKRFDCFGRKIRYPVQAEMTLDMGPYVVPLSEQQQPVHYALSGNIVHYGSSLDYGHYITVTRGIDNQWYMFDDDNRERVKMGALSTFDQPYVLFYTRVQQTAYS
uniref:Ubiquitin carboxyl-terminal hydrolase 36 n=1 Tax=Steinernema glaseri TaxID=37863 RepID=A0A1I7ZUE8_9BILA